MNRKFKATVLCLGSLGFVGVGGALADSLLLKDGRLISGQVTHTAAGYVVHGGAGDVTYTDEQVAHWTHAQPTDDVSLPATPPAAAPSALPAAAPGAAAAGKGRDKTSVQKTVAVLIERGSDALAAGDYRAARDSFADALSLEPKNVQAAQGAGYAYLQLNNYFKARDLLEIAYAGSQPPPRSVARNLAVALGKTHNPMRAAKVLKEYLVAHPQPLDEPALNALAAAMFQADEPTRHNSFFAQVGEFYDDYTRKLEATRPGEKRWGSQWLSSFEADRKLTAYNQKRTQIEALNKRMANDRAVFSAASHNAEDAIAASRLRPAAGAAVPRYKQQMSDADSDYRMASRELEQAMQGFEMPPIEEALAMVVPEFTTSAGTAVASASPGASSPGAASPGASSPVTPGPVAAANPGGASGSIFGPDSGASTSTGTGTPAAPPRTPSPRTRSPRTGIGSAGSTGSTGSTPPAVITAVRAEPPAQTRRLHVHTEAVAFPVAPDLLVTTAEAADHATSITVQLPDGVPTEAEVVAQDSEAGLALVRIKDKKVAYLPLAEAFAGGPVTCVGFPDVSLFDPVAAVIPGTAAIAKAVKAAVTAGGAGAGGTAAAAAPAVPEGKWVVNLARSPRLGGGPLLANGKVVGVQLATRDSDRGSVPFATLDDLKRLLSTNLPPAGSGGVADPRTVTMQLSATRDRG